jgi:hypothetical protein
MKLTNTSPYCDEDVRAWVMEALKSQGAKTTGVRVKVTGSSYGMRGRATLGHHQQFKDAEGMTRYGKLYQGKWMLIRLTAKAHDRLSDVAWLMMHEVQHLVGVGHKDMTPAMRKCWGQPMPVWAEGLELRLKDAPVKRSREQVLVDLTAKREALVARRAAKAREAYEYALRKEKAARRIRQKWEAKVKYYERKDKLAAKSP